MPVPPQRSTLPSRGCVAVLAAARIAEDQGQKGYRVRIIEGLWRYPYPRAGDHPSGTRTGAPAPIPERPGGLEGKQADTGQAKKTDVKELATVTVTGIRDSEAESLALKKAADAHVEVVTAEDIGKLPAKNVRSEEHTSALQSLMR